MWAMLVLAAFWSTGIAIGLWLRLGVWVWALSRFKHQDPVRLWWMSAGRGRVLPPAPAWYVEEGRRFSLPPPPTGDSSTTTTASSPA